jgi:hypothetical protein
LHGVDYTPTDVCRDKSPFGGLETFLPLSWKKRTLVAQNNYTKEKYEKKAVTIGAFVDLVQVSCMGKGGIFSVIR